MYQLFCFSMFVCNILLHVHERIDCSCSSQYLEYRYFAKRQVGPYHFYTIIDFNNGILFRKSENKVKLILINAKPLVLVEPEKGFTDISCYFSLLLLCVFRSVVALPGLGFPARRTFNTGICSD